MTKQDWIALGGPSPLAKWGFELMHSIVELCASQRQIHTIGRDDHVTLDPAHQTNSLWLAQFQNRPIVDVLATGHCRIVAFLDEPLEAIRFTMGALGFNFLDSLRHQTAAAIGYPALQNNPAALIIPRDYAGSCASLIDLILKHLELRPSQSDYDRLLSRSLSMAETYLTLAQMLERRQLDVNTRINMPELSQIEIKTAEQVLPPLMLMALPVDPMPIVWPHTIFTQGDTQKPVQDLLIELAGPPRFVFYGPYFYLPAGHWTVEAIFGFSDTVTHMHYLVDITDSQMLTQSRLYPTEPGVFAAQFSLTHERSHEPLEFRFKTFESAIEGQVALCLVRFYDFRPL